MLARNEYCLFLMKTIILAVIYVIKELILGLKKITRPWMGFELKKRSKDLNLAPPKFRGLIAISLIAYITARIILFI